MEARGMGHNMEALARSRGMGQAAWPGAWGKRRGMRHGAWGMGHRAWGMRLGVGLGFRVGAGCVGYTYTCTSTLLATVPYAALRALHSFQQEIKYLPGSQTVRDKN